MSTQLNTASYVNRNRTSKASALIRSLVIGLCASFAANTPAYAGQPNFRSAVVTNLVLRDQITGERIRGNSSRHLDQSHWRAPQTHRKKSVHHQLVRKPDRSRHIDQSDWRVVPKMTFPTKSVRNPFASATTRRSSQSSEISNSFRSAHPQVTTQALEDLRYQNRHYGSTTYPNGAKSEASAGAGIDTRTDARAGVWVDDGNRFTGVRADVSSGGFVDGRASQTGRIGNTEIESFVDGEAFSGGQTGAEAGLSKNGARMGADAFVGVRASARGGTRVGDVEAAGTAEGWAGLGAEAKLNAGYKHGKLKIGGDLGASLGVGGKLGVEVTIPVDKVGHGAESVAKGVGQGAQAVGKAVGKGTKTVGKELNKGAKKVGEALTGIFK